MKKNRTFSSLKPIHSLLPDNIKKLIKNNPTSNFANLKNSWENILGADLSKKCQLIKIQKYNSENSIFINVDRKYLIDVDYSRDEILEKINSFLEGNKNSIYYFEFIINHKKIIYRVLEILVNFRSKFLKEPYGDQGLIIHRTTYFRNNGFRKIPLMEDVDFLRRLNKEKDLKQLNIPIFISSRKWERTNIFLQAIKNWHFRRRWLKGESLKSIYSDYYKND